MLVSYDKLWKILIEKKMNRTDLKEHAGISFNILAKMGRNEFVSMEGASRYTFRAMNWSYSKGDTVDAACVILTDDFEKLADDSFSTNRISVVTLNRLYVAMTRSRGNLYLMRFSTFKKIRDSYIKV